MSKFARMLDVLDLYSDTVTVLTAEEVADRLQVSRPTAFRYVRELSESGFLANYSGSYSLGARIITLDYRIRNSDPLLNAAKDDMRSLSAETACTTILCRMYNEDIINVHHEAGFEDAALSFAGRGRPLPLFRGSASKTLLAFLPQPKLKKMYERHREDADVKALGAQWPAFRDYFSAIRQAGHYTSNQEIDPGTVGIAAPILAPGVGPVGSLSLVFSVERLPVINVEGLAGVLKARTRQIGDRLHLLPQESAGA